MAFIDKKDPVVLNIRLTSKGREQLSKGLLNFSYYAIGDSEIDYVFNKNAALNDPTYDPFNNSILRPADKNPSILSFLTRSLSGDPYNIIPSVPSTQTVIENDIVPLGFFQESGGTPSFITDSDHVKQPDIMIYTSGVTGGTHLKLNKAQYYQANQNEPAVNDLLLVRWTNPNGINTTGYTINTDFPLPNIFYKIEEVSGSLVGDNLVVKVDRPLPDFNGSGTTVAGAMIYYNHINYTGDTCYQGEDTEDAILSFLENCQCPTVRFPFWNMSIIFTDEIVGVQPEDEKFYKFNSRQYVGFLSYIQQQAITLKKLGVIHYTNNSVANTYAEELVYDIDDENRKPTLDIPLVMWHKSSTPTLGLRLRAAGNMKTLVREPSPQVDEKPTSLNTTYYDLEDPEGNVVGKVFTDLKLFVIEDQELLFAMSYKSNRSWTLPDYGVDINANVTFGCPACFLTYEATGITTTGIGNSDGQIWIHNIANITGDPLKGQLLLEVLHSGVTEDTQIFFNQITGDTFVTGLSAATYITKVTDLGANACTVTGMTDVVNPPSVIAPYDAELTQSLLNPDFDIIQVGGSPTSINITQLNVGDLIGKGFVAVDLTGSTDYQSWVTGTTSGDFWEEMNPDATDTSLTFLQAYTVYVRDVTGGTIGDFIPDGNNMATVWKDYIAVGSPFKSTFDSYNGGSYVEITNYLTTINPAINPLVGVIEFSLHAHSDPPLIWQESNVLDIPGTNQYNVTIRERVGTITAASVIKSVGFFYG